MDRTNFPGISNELNFQILARNENLKTILEWKFLLFFHQQQLLLQHWTPAWRTCTCWACWKMETSIHSCFHFSEKILVIHHSGKNIWNWIFLLKVKSELETFTQLICWTRHVFKLTLSDWLSDRRHHICSIAPSIKHQMKTVKDSRRANCIQFD